MTMDEKLNKRIAPKAFPQEDLDRFLESLPLKDAPPVNKPAPAPAIPAPAKPTPK